jgi:hypothetical protein
MGVLPSPLDTVGQVLAGRPLGAPLPVRFVTPKRSHDVNTLERIAVLETRMDDVHDNMAYIRSKLESMDTDLTKYKGMWGAISMIASAIMAAVILFKDYIVSKVTGN